MARRPKRTYNQDTGQWEVEKFYDSQDDQGLYWKDGIQVDKYGEPWEPLTPEQVAGNTSTPGTGVGGGPLPEVGDQSIDDDDPRNLVTVGNQIMPYSKAHSTASGGYGKKRVGEQSRRQMNLTGKRRSSILTS